MADPVARVAQSLSSRCQHLLNELSKITHYIEQSIPCATASGFGRLLLMPPSALHGVTAKSFGLDFGFSATGIREIDQHMFGKFVRIRYCIKG